MEEIRRKKTDKQRLSRNEKESSSKAWYKDKLDMYDSIAFGNANKSVFGFTNSEGGLLFDYADKKNHYQRMKINYDLYNGIVNHRDFEYLTKPFGDEFGDLPINFTHKDILSPKIKSLQGLEMKRPFEWKIIATNEEATSRKEKELFDRVKQWVINSIMEPIKVQLEQEALANSQGKELTDDEKAKIQQQVAEQLKTMTPPEVKKYMVRDHQDPAEVLATQIIEYIMQKEEFQRKTNLIWRHGLIS